MKFRALNQSVKLTNLPHAFFIDHILLLCCMFCCHCQMSVNCRILTLCHQSRACRCPRHSAGMRWLSPCLHRRHKRVTQIQTQALTVTTYVLHGRLTCTHTRLMALFPGLPRWAGTRKVKPIVLKQETVSGSGISWDICKSAPRFRHVTMPAPRHSVFYRLDALPAAQPVAVMHWWMHLLVPCLTSYCSQYLVV